MAREERAEIATQEIPVGPVEVEVPRPTGGPFQFVADGAANPEEMASIQSVLTEGEQEKQAAEEAAALAVSSVVTEQQVKTFLWATYEIHGVLTYPELWKRDDAFFTRIAVGMTPKVNELCGRFPALAHAIHTVDAAGTWGEFFWDYFKTWFLVWRRKQAEKIAKLAEEEPQHGQPYAQQQPEPTRQQQPAISATPTAPTAADPFIIP